MAVMLAVCAIVSETGWFIGSEARPISRTKQACRALRRRVKTKAPDAPSKLSRIDPALPKIDRTITKEPKYKSKPYYALLAFGPDLVKRVWLVPHPELH
jgi:hypothetical protein